MFSFGLWNTRGDKQQNTAEEKGKGQRPREKRWSQVPTPPPNPHSQPNQPARRADEATTTRAGKVHGSTSANVRARTGSRDLLRPPEPELRKCRCSAVQCRCSSFQDSRSSVAGAADATKLAEKLVLKTSLCGTPHTLPASGM